MKRSPIFDLIQVNGHSAIPKYMQVTKSILKAIDSGKIKKDDLLPSINEMSFELDISRRTAEKGYAYLKKIGILGSVPGKAFFIKRQEGRRKLKIALFFNTLSIQKKIVYDSLVSALGDNASIDLHIYNDDLRLFKKLLAEQKEEYAYYVIFPFFPECSEPACDIINNIPRKKLLLLDKKIDGVTGNYSAVLENFEKDIYHAMSQARERLHKYDTIKIIFPKNSYYPKDILTGLTRFCGESGFNYKEVSDIRKEPIQKGEVYISVIEDDLIPLIEKIRHRSLIVGKDLGIISYNETPLKKIILNGLTTISTDFYEMGRIAAKLISDRSIEQLEAPFYLRLRDSL